MHVSVLSFDKTILVLWGGGFIYTKYQKEFLSVGFKKIHFKSRRAGERVPEGGVGVVKVPLEG